MSVNPVQEISNWKETTGWSRKSERTKKQEDVGRSRRARGWHTSETTKKIDQDNNTYSTAQTWQRQRQERPREKQLSNRRLSKILKDRIVRLEVGLGLESRRLSTVHSVYKFKFVILETFRFDS